MDLGFDPAAVLAEAGIEPALFEDGENRRPDGCTAWTAGEGESGREIGWLRSVRLSWVPV
jgi:hypothetical protein